MKRLVINFARIGDLVMTLPILRTLGQEAEVHLLCREFGPSLFQGQSCPHCVHILRHPNRGQGWLASLFRGRERQRVAKKIAQIGFDEVYIFQEERQHVRRWIEQILPQAKILVFSGSRQGSSGQASCHYTELNRRHLESVGILMNPCDLIPQMRINDADKQRAQVWMKKYGEKVVGLQIGTQRTDRARWWRSTGPNLKSPPLSLWQEILRHLAEDTSITAFLLHGSPAETAIAQQVRSCLPTSLQHRVHVVTDSLPLDLAPAVFSLHYGFVSADTGPAHIAAAVSCPLIVFFGPSDRDFYRMPGPGRVEVLGDRPACSPCMTTSRYKTCQDNVCLNRLNIKDVVSAWKRLHGT